MNRQRGGIEYLEEELYIHCQNRQNIFDLFTDDHIKFCPSLTIVLTHPFCNK